MDFGQIDFVGIFSIENEIQDFCNKIREILFIPYGWAFDYKILMML